MCIRDRSSISTTTVCQRAQTLITHGMSVKRTQYLFPPLILCRPKMLWFSFLALINIWLKKIRYSLVQYTLHNTWCTYVQLYLCIFCLILSISLNSHGLVLECWKIDKYKDVYFSQGCGFSMIVNSVRLSAFVWYAKKNSTALSSNLYSVHCTCTVLAKTYWFHRSKISKYGR